MSIKRRRVSVASQWVDDRAGSYLCRTRCPDDVPGAIRRPVLPGDDRADEPPDLAQQPIVPPSCAATISAAHCGSLATS
jgi:hypothetical protein